MNPRRTLVCLSFSAVSSALLGCSTTTMNPGSRQEEGDAGKAGRATTSASNLAGRATTSGGASSGNSGVAGASGASAQSSGGTSATDTALQAIGGATSAGLAGGVNAANTTGGIAQTSGGAGGSSATTSPLLGGTAGTVSSGTLHCSADTDCFQASNVCQVAVCNASLCSIVNRDAGQPCGSAKVCSGTGSCGDCVPQKGKCEGEVPSVCSSQGTWDVGSACGLGDQCMDGLCIAPQVGWAIPITGDASAEIEDLALYAADSILAAGHAEAGTVSAGTQTFTTPASNHTNFVLAASRATGATPWSLPIVSTAWAWGSRIGVATDTTFIHGFRYQGTIETYANPNSYNYGGFFRGYNAARATQFTQRFNPIDTTTDPHFVALDGIVAQTNGSFALFTYEHGLKYSIVDNPSYATIEESDTDCVTNLSRLTANGIPQWNKKYTWCTTDNTKVIKLGPTGDLYLAGSGCPQNGLGPAPVLDSTTLQSAHSGVIARVSPTDGSVIKVVEFTGISTSYGRVDDLAFLPDGSVVALVSADPTMTLKIGTAVVGGGTYLVKLDQALNLVGYQSLGTAVGLGAYVTRGRLAAAPNGVLYVSGTFVNDFDFGGGTLVYQGTCERCTGGDAFVASYTPNFAHRWSRAISSASHDYATAIVAENGRAYASVVYGATIMVGGHPYAPAGSYVHASALFAFVE